MIMEQHVQVPTIEDLKAVGLHPKDLLVYAALKKYENSETHSCYPSLTTISSQVGASLSAVRRSISLLEKAGLLTQEFRQGESTIYHFSPYKRFEVFSKEFIESDFLSAMEKAYLISIQSKLFKKPENHTGVTSFTNVELSQSLNMGTKLISEADKQLQSKGILQLVKTAAKDSMTGLVKPEKVFDFDKFANAVVFEFNNVYGTIDKTAQHMQNQIDDQQKEIEELRLALKLNGIDPARVKEQIKNAITV